MKRAAKLELKLSDAKTGIFSGYASAFGGPPDSYGDVITKGAFAATLSAHAAAGTSPLMLWSHNSSDIPIGVWTELREDDFGLYAAGQLNLEIAKAREVLSSLKAGGGSLSIGFRTPKGGRVPAGDGIYELRNIDLVEISLVNIPANHRARILRAKSRPSNTRNINGRIAAATAELRNLK